MAVLKSMNISPIVNDLLIIDLVMSKGDKLAIVDSNHVMHIFDIDQEQVLKEFFVQPMEDYSFSNSTKFIYNSYRLIDIVSGQNIELQNRLFDPINDRIIEIGTGEITTYNVDNSNPLKYMFAEDIQFISSHSEMYFSGIESISGQNKLKIYSLGNAALVRSQVIQYPVNGNAFYVSSKSMCFYEWSTSMLYLQSIE